MGPALYFMDGKPVRSCITLAAAADECDVRTVEGYRDDPLDAGDPYGIQSPACAAVRLLHARNAGDRL